MQSISITDTVHESGINVSVSTGGSAGFSGSGDTATWSGGISGDYWQFNHYWSQLHFHSNSVFGWTESSSATFYYGVNAYNPISNGSYTCGC